jgi:hypothetical protein
MVLHPSGGGAFLEREEPHFGQEWVVFGIATALLP